MTGILTFLGSKTRVIAMAVAMLLLAAMSLTIPAFSGDAGALLAQTSDAISRFVGRSPGERDETDLLKGKTKKDRSLVDRLLGKRDTDGGPEQRALGKIFDTPPEEAVRQLGGDTLGPLALDTPGDALPIGDVGPAPRGFGGGPSGFPGGIATVVPGSPGGTTPGEPPVDPPGEGPVVGAVPEPGTWALMIMGFAFCGAALRRRRKVTPEALPASLQCDRA